MYGSVNPHRVNPLDYISVQLCFIFISRFGMSVNSDSVTRSVFYKYLHPKEVFIADGTLVPDIARKKVSLCAEVV